MLLNSNDINNNVNLIVTFFLSGCNLFSSTFCYRWFIHASASEWKDICFSSYPYSSYLPFVCSVGESNYKRLRSIKLNLYKRGSRKS